MPVSRSTRRLFTIVGLIAGSVTVWQTDPAWAREAGLDVWNVGRLEEQLRTSDADRDRLHAQECQQTQRYAVNARIVAEVVRGQRSLVEGGEVLWQINRADPGYVTALECYFHGPTPTARAANNLIQRVRRGNLPSAERDVAVARLTAEYVRTFGVLPTDGT